jgi:hypothetical protein
MFSAGRYKRMYRRFLGPLSQPITLSVWNGSSFDDYPNIPAHVSNYEERDLAEGGPIKLGDLRLIILAENLPTNLGQLNQGDVVTISGRDYGVIRWDANTRSVGTELMAYEATVRG